jgi:hypothetical protein
MIVTSILLAAVHLPASTGTEAVPKVVAVVSSLSGTATVRPRGSVVQLYDWLETGRVVDVSRGARLILTFASGRRFAVGGKARIAIGTEAPAVKGGTVRELEPVPELPSVPVVDDAEHVGRRAGAVRVRQNDGAIPGLYPCDGATVVADGARLTFAPVATVGQYEILIEDLAGQPVLKTQTDSSPLAVPPNVLKAGSRYYWRVRLMTTVGPRPSGEAEFSTLDGAAASRLATLEHALRARGDVESLGLLAAVNARVGRRAEADAILEQACSAAGAQEALGAVCRAPATFGNR